MKTQAQAARLALGAAAVLAAALCAAGADAVPDARAAPGGTPPVAAATPVGADRGAAKPAPAMRAQAPTQAADGAATRAEPHGPPGATPGAEPVRAMPHPGSAAAEPPAPEPPAPEPTHTAALAPHTTAPTAAPGPDTPASALGAGVAVAELPGAGEPIRPIPAAPDADPEKVALGRALFHDPRLSKDNTTACVSCHDLSHGGDDGRAVSVGVEGRTGPINSPTVFNTGLNFAQFWDGRAATLEHQIDGPVQASAELGSLWPEVIAKLYEHESYPARFGALYADGITRANAKDALATYMRSLLTPNSRFDRWLGGEADALKPLEKRGYALFKHYGCVSCHQGANVGGNMFQVFGVLNEYFKRRGNITDADMGRFNVTGNPADRHAFKVPSLRMAAHTAPYLHDGSAATLRDAVDAMFTFQLGREAPDEDKDAIVAFIATLAGENRELDP